MYSSLQKLLEARIELRGLLFGATRRLKDFIYLDLALELALKTCIEKSFSELKKAPIQIISPVEVCGFVDCVNKLIEVQSKVFNRPTILVTNRVTGEEEIPYGVVGVLTPDMPDVLSHVAIRARNNKNILNAHLQICFASCFDQDIIQDLKSKKGKEISITLKTSGLIYSEFKSSSSSNKLSSFCPRVTLRKKNFSGKFAISAEEFSCEMVIVY
ncbi:hypothetical protein B296_00024947 [Ensete ventricosum]|uniref:Alpha-glucan water dikinase phosphohistidine-like domain-containing protein n=1 Tax=Ensete ventricosum TaxID=4639 RepID=A0A427AU15_ENSVE|nr:hypothetical protein B296_00024947 [Ensete ventricosum]